MLEVAEVVPSFASARCSGIALSVSLDGVDELLSCQCLRMAKGSEGAIFLLRHFKVFCLGHVESALGFRVMSNKDSCTV